MTQQELTNKQTYTNLKMKSIELSKTLTNFIVSENKEEIDNTRIELNKYIKKLFELKNNINNANNL